jgi:phage tail-like protein
LDANGTRYHLLLGEEDWKRCRADDVPLGGVVESPPREGGARQSRDVPVPRLAWNDERSELTLHPRLFQFVAARRDTAPELSMRRGAGRDRYGNWYWIDESEQRIRVNSEGTRRASDFWPPEEDACARAHDTGDFRPRDAETPRAPLRLRGLAVTEDHYLVVGVVEPAGLLYFDLHAGGAPQQLLWPKGVPFSPFDIAHAPGGGLFVLDRDHARYWALDRRFNLMTEGQQLVTLKAGAVDDFQPRGGGGVRRTPAREFGEGVSLDSTSPLAATDPIAIDAMPDGTVLILDRNPGEDFCLVFRYRSQTQLGPPASTESMLDLIEAPPDEDAEASPPNGAGFTLKGYDFAFAPAHAASDGARVLDRLYFVAENGNQSFAFNVAEDDGALELRPLADYLPMRFFGGRALVGAGDEVFYDYGESFVPLVEQRRPRYEAESVLYTPLDESGETPAPGTDLSLPPFHAFDGREPDCVWHRLMLDACIPPETEVSVASRAANDERELALAEWRPEPRLYQRASGSELPFVSGERYGTWELLLQNARGRFLQLRLELRGNGRTTPRLRALRAYYPRFSYLDRYLPAVYREEQQSASFLDRFLANFEGFYTTIEDRIAAAQMLFDVRSAPPDALAWLTGWFGTALDPAWDGRRTRLFIKNAMRLFQMRGTIRGLQTALRLSLEECVDESLFDESKRAAPSSRAGGIRIVEKFRTRRTPAVVLGDPTGGQEGPRFVTLSGRWSPSQGGEDLRRRYADFIGGSASESPPRDFTLTAPSDLAEAATWRQFTHDALGFTPTAAGRERTLWQSFLAGRYEGVAKLNDAYKTSFNSFADVPLPDDMPPVGARRLDWQEFLGATEGSADAYGRKRWREFLARRYHNVGALNAAHGKGWRSFALVSLAERLPADGQPLLDWYQFESAVLPMGESAHRFTVLLPLPPSASYDAAEQQRRIELATRIVRLEKPAHTVFDVKFYWQLFRLGEARLGEDTLLDLGSRAPDLMSPLAVGRGRLTEGYLAPGHPRDVADRQVLGRDRLSG